MIFINNGSDYNLLKSLNKQGLVQKEIQVRGKHSTYTRKQWVSAGDNSPNGSNVSHKEQDSHSKKSKSVFFPKVDCGKSHMRAFSYPEIVQYYNQHKSEIKVPFQKFIYQNYTESTGNNQTYQMYSSSHGYTRERQKLHNQIVQGIVDSASSPKNGERPIAILMGGGSASGKGTIRSSMVIPRLQSKGISVGISDCDDIKEQLPEYEHFKAQDVESAAFRVHQESMDIAMEAFDALIKNNKHLLFDGTMKSVNKYTKMIDKLRKAGYQIQIVGTDVPIETARQRSQQRAKVTGRGVPDNIIEMTHGGFASTYSELLPLVDSYSLYDNSGDHPVLIQDETQVYKPELLQQFTKKGQDYQDKRAIQRISKTYGVSENEIKDLYSAGASLDEIEEYYSLGLDV